MKNPFVYGKEVSKENFCNRVNEIKEITRDIENSQSILIFSQRRFGKTSLIKRVYEDLDTNRIIPVYVDLYPVLSEEDFIRIYAKELAKVITKSMAERLTDLADVFKRIRPVYSIDQNGQGSFSIDFAKNEIIPCLEDVLDGFNRYVEKENKQAVVCFDEFQQINQLKTDRLEKHMRSKFQTHKDISYIFMGSKKHLIYDMFNNPNRPFYRSSKPFPLNKIDETELVKFIIERFKSSGKRISEALAKEIIAECETHPYYIQYLSHIIWEKVIDKETVSKEDLEESINTLLVRESSTFESTWDMLAVKQKQLLIALAESGEQEKIFAADFLQKYNLGSASSVQRAVKSLIDKDLIDHTEDTYSIIDIVFRKWIIKKNT